MWRFLTAATGRLVIIGNGAQLLFLSLGLFGAAGAYVKANSLWFAVGIPLYLVFSAWIWDRTRFRLQREFRGRIRSWRQ
jgi:hypothetical protein